MSRSDRPLHAARAKPRAPVTPLPRRPRPPTRRSRLPLHAPFGWLTLVISGIVVPVRVRTLAVNPDRGVAKVDAVCRVYDSQHTRIEFEFPLDRALDRSQVDVVRMLTPALLAFAREVLAPPRDPATDPLKALGDSPTRQTGPPIALPPDMMQAVAEAMFDLGNACVNARGALERATGWTNGLGHVRMCGGTFEDWMRTTRTWVAHTERAMDHALTVAKCAPGAEKKDDDDDDDELRRDRAAWLADVNAALRGYLVQLGGVLLPAPRPTTVVEAAGDDETTRSGKKHKRPVARPAA